MSSENPKASKTVQVTIAVPQERLEAFHRIYQDFLGADTVHDVEIRQRAGDRDQGIASLRELVRIAQGNSGQCRYIARFLAGLYNGPRFPFDLTDLRAIDDALFEHTLAVLRMDHAPEKEVHNYFSNGSKLWEEDIIKGWDLDKEAALNAAYLIEGFLEDSKNPQLRQLAASLNAWRASERSE